MFQIQRTASRWTQPLSAGLSKRTPAGEVALSCHPNPLLVERGWRQGRGSLLMCVCVCEHYWWRETIPFALFPKIRGRMLPNPKKESKPSRLPLVWELVVPCLGSQAAGLCRWTSQRQLHWRCTTSVGLAGTSFVLGHAPEGVAGCLSQISLRESTYWRWVPAASPGVPPLGVLRELG